MSTFVTPVSSLVTLPMLPPTTLPVTLLPSILYKVAFCTFLRTLTPNSHWPLSLSLPTAYPPVCAPTYLLPLIVTGHSLSLLTAYPPVCAPAADVAV